MIFVFIYSDYRLGIFKEIIDSITSTHTFSIVNDAHKAHVALVLFERPIKKITDLLNSYPHLSVLTTMIPHDFNDDRVFFLNSRMRDLSVNTFVNYLWSLRNQISHIDIKMCYPNVLNVKTEVMEALSIVSMLVGVSSLNVRFSFNDSGAHASGYDRDRNLTTSCYVNTGAQSSFYEEIQVITRDGQRYTLTGSDRLGQHTYEERYGSAWQTIVEEAAHKHRYYQQNIHLIILKVKGPTRGRGPATSSRPERGRSTSGISSLLDTVALARLSNRLNDR